MEQNRNPIRPSGNLSHADTEFWARFWARIGAAYPRQEITVATMELYTEKLSRYGPRNLSRVLEIIIENWEYFPSLAEIIHELRVLPREKELPAIEKPLTPEERTQVDELVGNLANKFKILK